MPKIVGKFQITNIQDVLTVNMPVGSIPLHFDMQRGTLCLWAVIDPDEELTVPYKFRMAGTGHLLDLVGDARYMNTVLWTDGSGLVFHFFYLANSVVPAPAIA